MAVEKSFASEKASAEPTSAGVVRTRKRRKTSDPAFDIE